MERNDWTKQQIESALEYIKCKYQFTKSKYPSNIKHNKLIFAEINEFFPNMFSSVFEVYCLITGHKTWELFCPICGKRNIMGYDHCSCKCTQLDKTVRDKNKNTRKIIYGDPNYNNRDKNKSTCIKKYGVANVFQLENIKCKSSKTKLQKYGDAKYTNTQKMVTTKRTTLDNDGKNIFERAVVHARQTMQKRYGVNTPMEYKIFADKQRAIMKSRHGYVSPFQLESIRKKLAKKTNKSKGELLWLDNLQIPNDKLHRQVVIGTKVVDGFDPKNNIIYEFLGDFWHGHPTQITRYNKKNKRRYKKFLKERFVATEERFNLLCSLGYKIRYCWQTDFQNNKKFYREYKGKLEYK